MTKIPSDPPEQPSDLPETPGGTPETPADGSVPPSDRPQTPIGDKRFFEILNGRMSKKQRDTVDMLGKLKSKYVPCGRDKVLAATFGKFLDEVMATDEQGNRGSGDIFYVVGDSGAGKSRAVKHLLTNNDFLQPMVTAFGQIDLWVSISLHGPGTLRTLGMKIMRATGYVGRDIEEGVLWALLPNHLHEVGVLVIHIDETQHMLRQSPARRQALADALKGVTNFAEWPVSFVLSGMPETTELSRLDEQMERRQYIVDLPPVDLQEERVLVERIISQMCETVSMGTGKVIQQDLPERIAHAARYQYGRIVQVVRAGIHTAFVAGAKELHRDHFAMAYLERSHARGNDDMNPFLVDDWQSLPEGLFVLDRSGKDD